MTLNYVVQLAVVTPMIALVYFRPRFSLPLLVLGSPSLITAPGSFLKLALMCRRDIGLSGASRG